MLHSIAITWEFLQIKIFVFFEFESRLNIKYAI